jgi:glycosyltransferase involved in cell wall biosynthesis
MAAGTPVVTTSAGNEGIGATQGKELLIADDPSDFAAKVVYLLNNREPCEKLSEAAKSFVNAHFDWTTNISHLEGILTKCAKSHNKLN